jgi:hypothetical protein
MSANVQAQMEETPVAVTPMAEERREEEVMKKNMSVVTYVVFGVLILLGVGTGYLLSGRVGGSTAAKKTETIKSDKTEGVADEKTFKDSATGVLQKGGVDGEGSHQLVRDGGPSQTVYLVSSIVDLDKYAGKKVKVWGQTMAAKKVSWLMDVGKIELLQ